MKQHITPSHLSELSPAAKELLNRWWRDNLINIEWLSASRGRGATSNSSPCLCRRRQ
jgi:hypothetical protein